MRPFDEIPFEESDYSEVALMVASVREFPRDDFAHGLDERVGRRFASEPAVASGGRGSSRRLSRWAAGLVGGGVALAVAAVAAVVVLSGGGKSAVSNGTFTPTQPLRAAQNATGGGAVAHGTHKAPASVHAKDKYVESVPTIPATASSGAAGVSSATNVPNATANFTAVAPGTKQIRSAQLDLSTQNLHVNQVAQEIFGVVGSVHGTVLSSHITTATRNSGGGYASFSLSIPTGSLQQAMTELSRLNYVAVVSSENNSTNVSHQYNSDQRQLSDAEALRTSLLKQLAAATTDQQIDSIKAQLKLAEAQITSAQSTIGSLQHRISYSNLDVQLNQNGLPIVVTHRHQASGGFTLSRAGHDALHVLVVSAGVALIALAVMIPVGLVVALLMWLWVWLRQRRREHALDAAS